MRARFVVGALLVAAAYACGSSDDSEILGPNGTDAGTSSGADSSTPTNANDAGKQGGSDAGTQTGTDAGTSTDAGSDAGHDAGTVVDAGSDAGVCIKGTTANGDGHHNPGDDCLTCHDGTGSAPKWTFAGTLYDKTTGGTAIGGATIEVIDANAQKIDLVTSTNGNFYTGTTVKFPLQVRASDCPNNSVMTAAVSNGSCNSCHDSAMRISLP